MNSQTHGIQIHPEGVPGLTAGIGVSTGGAARKGVGLDWITSDARRAGQVHRLTLDAVSRSR
jgi:hypothetical protein